MILKKLFASTLGDKGFWVGIVGVITWLIGDFTKGILLGIIALIVADILIGITTSIIIRGKTVDSKKAYSGIVKFIILFTALFLVQMISYCTRDLVSLGFIQEIVVISVCGILYGLIVIAELSSIGENLEVLNDRFECRIPFVSPMLKLFKRMRRFFEKILDGFFGEYQIPKLEEKADEKKS